MSPAQDREPTALSLWHARARKHFHIALAGIVLPWCAPLLSWIMVLLHRDAADEPWRSRLFILAVLDTLVLGALIVRGPVTSSLRPPVRPHERPRLGITLHPTTTPGEIEIAQVLPGAPAERAGLHPGDRIVALDGRPVATPEELAQLIAATKPGGALRLRISRSGVQWEVSVTPQMGLRSPPAKPPPLFAPVETPSGWQGKWLRLLVAGNLATALVLALVSVLARHRGVRSIAPALVLLVVLVGTALAMVITLEVFRRLGGISLGAVLVSSLVATGTLVSCGLALQRRFREAPARQSAATRPTVWRGILYSVAGMGRVGILLAVLARITSVRLPTPASSVLGFGQQLGADGVALVLLAIVILGPLGEELLFRGLLLSWLRTWMSPTAAVGTSAVMFSLVHWHYGVSMAAVFVLGLVLGWARLHTGNLRACVILHMLANLVPSAVVLIKGFG